MTKKYMDKKKRGRCEKKVTVKEWAPIFLWYIEKPYMRKTRHTCLRNNDKYSEKLKKIREWEREREARSAR